MMDERSERNLVGVHPDLDRVVREAHRRYTTPERTFVVTEGLRSMTRQAELVKAGASRTLQSRHLTGHAIDVAVKVGFRVTWAWHVYEELAKVFKASAASLKVPLVWGGDWVSLKDGVHFEIGDLRNV